MLRKQILSLSVNYKKLILATKLKHIDNLCQIRTRSGYVKQLSILDHEKAIYKVIDSSKSSLVLDLLKFNVDDPNLNASDIIEALMKLRYLSDQENLPPEQLVRSDFLKDLYALINAKPNDLTLAEAVGILNLVFKLKVEVPSIFISNLLERVNKLLETASIYDYNRIMQVIERFLSDPIAQIIRTRLVRHFTLHKMTLEFDQNDPDFLTEALKFASFYTYNEKIFKTIVDALNNYNFESLSPQNILSVMESLNLVEHYPMELDKILLKTQNAVSMNIQKFENLDISIMFRQTARRISNHRLERFYNKNFFDKGIQKLISSECSLRHGIVSLAALIYIKHTSKELLDYLSGMLYIEKEVNGSYMNNNTIPIMLEACADLRYKPLCWEIIRDFFTLDANLAYSQQKLLYRASHLACLGCYELKILNKVFARDVDFDDRLYTHYTFLRLYQMLKTKPGYIGPLPSQRQIMRFESLIRVNSYYSFYTNLVEALGGPEYVKTNIRTKLYHVIDHVIAFQPGGKPIAINTEDKGVKFEYLEDLIFPKNSKVIAVISVPNGWYARNTKKMLGKYVTYFETLETLSCRVVAISGSDWMTQPKESKTDYLMGFIRKKLEDEEC